ncbi:MAG: J domain-containing protein [Synergistaceae bacterium]|nr:J domain-containing protein [Synergistaceae bacterium]
MQIGKIFGSASDIKFTTTRKEIEMNIERYYHYKILGLQIGASQAEIKKAYRSLVKLYHPDRDQSYDAEVMYREIHTAYKALLEQPFSNETSAETINYHDYSKRTTQTSSHSSGKTRQSATDSNSTERTTRTSEDLIFWANWEKECYEKATRVPIMWVFFRFIVSLISFFLYGPVWIFINSDFFKNSKYVDKPAYIVWIVMNSDNIIVIGILIALIITLGVFFLVSNKVMSKGLAIRITCFCPYVLSMWLFYFIAEAPIYKYLITSFVCYTLLTCPIEDFYKRKYE